jgi:hypothetical protein
MLDGILPPVGSPNGERRKATTGNALSNTIQIHARMLQQKPLDVNQGKILTARSFGRKDYVMDTLLVPVED